MQNMLRFAVNNCSYSTQYVGYSAVVTTHWNQLGVKSIKYYGSVGFQ